MTQKSHAPKTKIYGAKRNMPPKKEGAKILLTNKYADPRNEQIFFLRRNIFNLKRVSKYATLEEICSTPVKEKMPLMKYAVKKGRHSSSAVILRIVSSKKVASIDAKLRLIY